MLELLPTVAIEPMNRFAGPAEQILGGFNEVERRYAPDELFAAGDGELLAHLPLISIVGSRKPSADGIAHAREVAGAVVAHGGVVVSGLARGIDTVAHETAVAAGGRTVAVIGTGLSEVYPRENAGLQESLMEHHLVISQFPDGYPSRRGNFVLRNRTMALVSQGTVIVEAGEKSGTQHQGWEAIRLGRILFLPETFLDADFEWPRKMFEYGAFIFRDVRELLDLFDEYLPSSRGNEDLSALLH